MNNNALKVHAHLARANQLLKEKNEGLAFGVDEVTFDYLHELGDPLSIVLGRLYGPHDVAKVSSTSRYLRIEADPFLKPVQKHLKGLQDGLMVYHQKWNRGREEDHTDPAEPQMRKCFQALSKLSESKVITTETEDVENLNILYIELLLQDPLPLSPQTAIDFARECLLRYPNPYSNIHLLNVLHRYLRKNVSGYTDRYRAMFDRTDRLKLDYTTSEMSCVVDIIDLKYPGYKSSVLLVHINELKDAIDSTNDLSKTFMVHHDNYLHISCLFVDVSKAQKSVFILNCSNEEEKTALKEQLARLPLDQYNICSLDLRLSSDKDHNGAIAIEDSIRLFLEPRVPHVPDSREENWGSLPVKIVKHERYSHLLLYSECLSRYEMKLMLGQNSPYIWVIDGRQQSCLLNTYNLLHKLQLIERAYLDGEVQ